MIQRDTRAGMESSMNLPNKYIFFIIILNHYLSTLLLASRSTVFEEKLLKINLEMKKTYKKLP